MQEPTLYSLALGNEYIIICPTIGEQISIKASGSNFSGTYNIEGSPESELLKELNRLINIAEFSFIPETLMRLS